MTGSLSIRPQLRYAEGRGGRQTHPDRARMSESAGQSVRNVQSGTAVRDFALAPHRLIRRNHWVVPK